MTCHSSKCFNSRVFRSAGVQVPCAVGSLARVTNVRVAVQVRVLHLRFLVRSAPGLAFSGTSSKPSKFSSALSVEVAIVSAATASAAKEAADCAVATGRVDVGGFAVAEGSGRGGEKVGVVVVTVGSVVVTIDGVDDFASAAAVVAAAFACGVVVFGFVSVGRDDDGTVDAVVVVVVVVVVVDVVVVGGGAAVVGCTVVVGGFVVVVVVVGNVLLFKSVVVSSVLLDELIETV